MVDKTASPRQLKTPLAILSKSAEHHVASSPIIVPISVHQNISSRQAGPPLLLLIIHSLLIHMQLVSLKTRERNKKTPATEQTIVVLWTIRNVELEYRRKKKKKKKSRPAATRWSKKHTQNYVHSTIFFSFFLFIFDDKYLFGSLFR